jgi:predicted DNA-binding antitoxin AbrB/MazE fold protein
MSLEIEATYQNGVFRPAQEVPLQEGQKVTLTIQPVGSAAKRFCGSLRWTGDPEELHAYLNDPDESSWGAP